MHTFTLIAARTDLTWVLLCRASMRAVLSSSSSQLLQHNAVMSFSWRRVLLSSRSYQLWSIQGCSRGEGKPYEGGFCMQKLGFGDMRMCSHVNLCQFPILVAGTC